MMRTILLTFSMMFAGLIASAQVVISPDPLVFEANAIAEIFQWIDITNEGTEDVELYWQYEEGLAYPEDWKTQICDQNLCYDWDNFVSGTVAPNVIPAGETKRWSIKIKNINESTTISGETFGILRLFDDTAFENEVASTDNLSSSTFVAPSQDLVIYPNPAEEFISIKNDSNVESVSLYNIVGRRVLSFTHNQGEMHDISHLHGGMYLVRLADAEGEILKTLRLSKR